MAETKKTPDVPEISICRLLASTVRDGWKPWMTLAAWSAWLFTLSWFIATTMPGCAPGECRGGPSAMQVWHTIWMIASMIGSLILAVNAIFKFLETNRKGY